MASATQRCHHTEGQLSQSPERKYFSK